MKSRRIAYLTTILLVVCLNLFGQPGNPGDGPIGGVIYLLLAGLGFGIYSLRNRKK